MKVKTLWLFILITSLNLIFFPLSATPDIIGNWKLDSKDLVQKFQIKAKDLSIHEGTLTRESERYKLQLIGTEHSKRTLLLPVKTYLTVTGTWKFTDDKTLQYLPEDIKIKITLDKDSEQYKKTSIHKQQRMLFTLPIIQALAASTLAQNKQKYLSDITEATQQIVIINSSKSKISYQLKNGDLLTEIRLD